MSIKSILEKQLRIKYRNTNGGARNITLPDKISFEESGNILFINLNAKCVTVNKQKDEAAFEAWALALYYWINKYKKIVLRWSSPEVDKESVSWLHYQQFLYRVRKFSELNFLWFDFDGPLNDSHQKDKLLLNSPNEIRSLSLTSRGDSEHCLEQNFIKRIQWRSALARVSGFSEDLLDSQLPVGLFRGKVEGKNAVFPGKKGAIDLWAVAPKSRVLHIFELKSKNNIKIGIVSELFCYAMMMRDACLGNFIWENDGRGKLKPRKLINSKNIKEIRAHFLAPELHPLVNEGMMNILNRAFKNSEFRIRFDFLRFSDNNGASVKRQWL